MIVPVDSDFVKSGSRPIAPAVGAAPAGGGVPPSGPEPAFDVADLSRTRAEMAEIMDAVEIDLAEVEEVLESILPARSESATGNGPEQAGVRSGAEPFGNAHAKVER